MRLLLIDNYDSFTRNIAHYLQQVSSDVELTVVMNDDEDLFERSEFARFDGIVISPGPGRPDNTTDLGIGKRILANDRRPLLGICLGHQALAVSEGGRVVRAPEPVHGRSWLVHHDGTGVFTGLSNPVEAMRYHSLIVADPIPDTLRVTARANEIIMGLAHRHLPRWGVQFHPESIGTPAGHQMLLNFVNSVRDEALHKPRSKAVCRRHSEPDSPAKLSANALANPAAVRQPQLSSVPACHLHWRDLGPAVEPVDLVQAAIVAGQQPLLLQSALVIPGLSRFSYIALAMGLDDQLVTDCAGISSQRDSDSRSETQPTSFQSNSNSQNEIQPVSGSLIHLLNAIERPVVHPGLEPPFDFHGGAIGWLGYEYGTAAMPADPHHPDAAFRAVHSYLVVDHSLGRLYAAVCDTEPSPRALGELEPVFQAMSVLAAQTKPCLAGDQENNPDTKKQTKVVFTPRHDDTRYLALIAACQERIVEGESYELCLTNQLHTQTALSPWALYCTLQQNNPAPYAAYLPIADTTVVSASPERFLKVSANRRVEAKPIKGTIRRGNDLIEDDTLKQTLYYSEKDRAENMMIVDLLRHDLSSVCEVGSVEVPVLNTIESYPAVHQMVSTIAGTLLPESGVAEVLDACFPGGSMTGAPKKRSMQILREFEAGPRGVYSGTLGWLGYGGQAELSIVIRSAVCRDDGITIGCGGAITILSDPEDELDEMHLKARAMMRAVAKSISGNPEAYTMAGQRSAVAPMQAESPDRTTDNAPFGA